MRETLHELGVGGRSWIRRRLLASRLIALATLAALACLGAACSGDSASGAPPSSSTRPPSSTRPADPVALRVDGRAVRESAIRDLRRDLRFAHRPATRAAAERLAITDALIDEQARRLGVSVPAGAVERLVQTQLAQPGAKAALQSHDISLGHFRDRLRRQLLTKRLIAQQFAGVRPTEAQLRARYRRDHHKFFVPLGVRLRVIQVRSFLQGETVLRLLHGGRSWRSLVGQFSLNQGSGPYGDIGWGAPSLLPGRSGRVLAHLRAGEVAPTPVRLGSSYAVMKVTDRRPAHYDTFRQVRHAIEVTYSSALRQSAFNRWMAKRRRSAHVERVG